MAGVEAFAIARFSSRRVRLISRRLRMALARRDMATILSIIRTYRFQADLVTPPNAAIFRQTEKLGHAC